MKTTYPTQTHRLLNGGTTDRESAVGQFAADVIEFQGYGG